MASVQSTQSHCFLCPRLRSKPAPLRRVERLGAGDTKGCTMKMAMSMDIERKIRFSIESKKVEVVSLRGPTEDRQEMFDYCRKHSLTLRTMGVVPGSEGRLYKVTAERDV